ncbi:hypothetical protein BCRE_3170 [Candidatus Burkholderia crenata]|nr:hypothetical protein BCRE_3170 [Candidatus Burkholderia crenata]
MQAFEEFTGALKSRAQEIIFLCFIQNRPARLLFCWQPRGVIMQIGSIVRSVHIAVPQGARGIVMRILGDMALVAWYADEPGTSKLLNTEPFFLEDLIDTGELVRPANALMH